MKKNLLKLSGITGLTVGLGAVIAPVVAFAQQTGGILPTPCSTLGNQVNSIQTFICKLNEILTSLLPFLLALGMVYFVWGVISYVIADEEEAKKKGRDRMIYGIIGFAVIVGVWSLVHFIVGGFGLNNSQSITYPTVPY